MAALLHQSGFTGKVLAYSWGERSSRDLRYGRAVARALGYPHVAVPRPDDFITRYLEDDAWRFDAEWSAELNWPFRSAYNDPSLGDTSGYRLLSGMYGDATLGKDNFRYRQRIGDKPLAASGLQKIYLQTHQEYAPAELIFGLFGADTAADARRTLDGILEATLLPLARLVPFYALSRAEFRHRQFRHTCMVAQCVERDKAVLTPFVDTAVVDFTLRIPYDSWHDKKIYKRMLRDRFPKVASVPYAVTGMPIADAPFRSALKWRLEKALDYLPGLQKRLKRRNAMFRFQEGVSAKPPISPNGRTFCRAGTSA